MKKLSAIIAFLASFLFFAIAYPYHLVRREQMNLFVYDWDYITQTYHGAGWFARFFSSFLDQFFCVPFLGPIIVAALLTAIAVVTYRIFRKFSGNGISMIAAVLMFAWSFMRECGNLYVTRYTVVTLGFLSLILLALQFKKLLAKAAAAIVFLGFGAWALGTPYNSNYGKLWSVPRIEYDRVIGLDAECARENWDKVLKLSRKDLHMREASFCYNLALAMKGQLGNHIFDHSQGGPYDLILPVSAKQSTFTNCLAGEQWYQFGDMTIAEQSAITALQASPEHTGARFINRLARVNMIAGHEASAQKYLNLLSKTLFYGKWAGRMLAGTLDEDEIAWLENSRKNMAVSDFVHLADNPHTLLKGMLEVNPDNTPVREFMLCFDLMRYDLEMFIEDYNECRLDARSYREAAVIWMGQQGITDESVADEYGIDDALLQRMNSFFRYPERYRNTYWYYYTSAQNAPEQ